jgi:hypothetical protein
MDASSVTRSPLTKRAGSPSSAMAREIALPPPWTITGSMPTHSMKVTSVRMLSWWRLSSMALPPNLTTIVAPRKLWT